MFGMSDSVIHTITQIFEKYPQIESAIIYGSRARGNYRGGSDIDIALSGDINRAIAYKIAMEQDDTFIPHKVDICVLTDLENIKLCQKHRK